MTEFFTEALAWLTDNGPAVSLTVWSLLAALYFRLIFVCRKGARELGLLMDAALSMRGPPPGLPPGNALPEEDPGLVTLYRQAFVAMSEHNLRFLNHLAEAHRNNVDLAHDLLHLVVRNQPAKTPTASSFPPPPAGDEEE